MGLGLATSYTVEAKNLGSNWYWQWELQLNTVMPVCTPDGKPLPPQEAWIAGRDSKLRLFDRQDLTYRKVKHLLHALKESYQFVTTLSAGWNLQDIHSNQAAVVWLLPEEKGNLVFGDPCNESQVELFYMETSGPHLLNLAWYIPKPALSDMLKNAQMHARLLRIQSLCGTHVGAYDALISRIEPHWERGRCNHHWLRYNQTGEPTRLTDEEVRTGMGTRTFSTLLSLLDLRQSLPPLIAEEDTLTTNMVVTELDLV